MKNQVIAAAVMAAATISTPALASHVSNLGAVDAIDAVLASGGGNASGTLSTGADDAFIVFAANSGDTLNITVNQVGTWYLNAVLLFDTGDGNIQVGDNVGVTNFNSSQVGNGSPLQILAHIGSLEFSTSGALNNFAVTQTGQYAIGLTSANDSKVTGWSLTGSGNTGTVGAPNAVPLPATLPLMLAGMLGMGAVSRRRKKAVS